jgi:hypothetical protein
MRRLGLEYAILVAVALWRRLTGEDESVDDAEELLE